VKPASFSCRAIRAVLTQRRAFFAKMMAAVNAAKRARIHEPMADGGQWLCAACGFKNRAQNDVCGGAGPMGCKSPRDDAGGDGGDFVEEAASDGGEWVCPCGFTNRAVNTVCGGVNGKLGCKAPRGGGAAPAYAKGGGKAFKGGGGGCVGGGGGGEWMCSCGFKNRAGNEVCGGNGPMGCKNPPPAAAPARGAKRSFTNMMMDYMVGGGGKGGKSFGGCFAPAPSAAPGIGEWICDCGFKNKDRNEVCGGAGPMGCKAPRPAPVAFGWGGGGGGKGFGGKKGGGGGGAGGGQDWICAGCNFKNRAANDVCGGKGPMGCKEPKPSDWVCDCGFTNRPTNEVCGGKGPKGCKAPKPEAE